MVSNQAISKGGRRSPAADKRNSASCVPWASRPPPGCSLSQKGGEGQRAQASRPECPPREVEGEREQGLQTGGMPIMPLEQGLKAVWHREPRRSSYPYCALPGSCVLESQAPRRSTFCLPWSAWDAQRWGRHSSPTQSLSKCLRDKGLQVTQLSPGLGWGHLGDQCNDRHTQGQVTDEPGT